MKLFVALMLLMPLALKAQTTSSYQEAMGKFKKFYNAGQGDSINAMFGHGWDQFKSTDPLWTNAKAAQHLKEYGKLKSFKLIGIDESDPQKVHVFETIFSKAGAKTTSLTLDSSAMLGTFRFDTSSDEITNLLKNSRKAR